MTAPRARSNHIVQEKTPRGIRCRLKKLDARAMSPLPVHPMRARTREAVSRIAMADAKQGWPADHVERWPIDRLIPFAKNARNHTPPRRIRGFEDMTVRPGASRSAPESLLFSAPLKTVPTYHPMSSLLAVARMLPKKNA